jgi:hypothetical protein
MRKQFLKSTTKSLYVRRKNALIAQTVLATGGYIPHPEQFNDARRLRKPGNKRDVICKGKKVFKAVIGRLNALFVSLLASFIAVSSQTPK